MSRLAPEAVAAHAAAWPCGLGAGRWRVWLDDGPALVACDARSDSGHIYITFRGYRWRTDEFKSEFGPGDWTPVRPDGSDLPDERAMARLQEIIGERLDSLIDATSKARAQGRAEELAAIVAGVESVLADVRRDLAWTGLGYGHALQAKEEALSTLCDRMKAGEWSAKP